MATNQTTNYQLNQWEPTDAVQRAEFNADNAKLDAALNALSDQVAKKADEEDLTALSESVAAVSAGMGNCDMELLTYTGTGAMGQSSPTRITFSSLPDAFLVVGDLAILLGRGGVKEAILACKDVTYSESFVSTSSLTWTGTQMSLYNGVDARYQMNSENKMYWVLGLKKKN